VPNTTAQNATSPISNSDGERVRTVYTDALSITIPPTPSKMIGILESPDIIVAAALNVKTVPKIAKQP
jgi:hypothetical protein